MRGDGDDLKQRPVPERGDVVAEVLIAIHMGSKQVDGARYRSPFLHASLSRPCALRWLKMARIRDPRAYLVEIDLSKLPPERIIDFSTYKQQNVLLRGRVLELGHLIHVFPEPPTVMAENYREVLLVARGYVPREWFEKVDP